MFKSLNINMSKKVYFFDLWKTLVYSNFNGIDLKKYLKYSDLEFLNYENFLFKNYLNYENIYSEIQKEFSLNEEQVQQIRELNLSIENNSQVYDDTISSLESLSQKYQIYLVSDGFQLMKEYSIV